ncbi:hypothetical protein ELI_2381 [Eubacterium callanderi]|uniref:Uncharacterized protein n=1 Tax=Eubacterium callanderi TaxID=53442 RepID=E3GDY1_9FIRM|nr:hypothetical protein ELI_2381 [Eubacterium callanderi]
MILRVMGLCGKKGLTKEYAVCFYKIIVIL